MWFPLTLLTAFLWAVINVGNSTLVARYHKYPSFLLWVQTCFSMTLLLCIALLQPVSTPWALSLFLCATLSYLGDLFFFRLLDRLDVSVLNAAWAMQAVFYSIAGFALFHETWSPQQFLGAAFVLSGVLLISFFHAHISLFRTLLSLAVLGLLYVPVYILRKAALVSGAPLLPVVFWMILGRDLCGFILPLMLPSQRRFFFKTLPECHGSFFALSGLMIICFYATEFFGALANRTGPLSLISVVGNTQPFFVLLLSGFLFHFAPKLAPKELFSIRSTSLKTLSFLIVFLGLALLLVSQ